MNSTIDHERDRCALLINGFDFAEELGEASDEILVALRNCDHATVGRMVEAVYLAYADRIATQDAESDFEPPEHSAPRVYADDAARRVLLSVSIERAAVDRMAGTAVAA